MRNCLLYQTTYRNTLLVHVRIITVTTYLGEHYLLGRLPPICENTQGQSRRVATKKSTDLFLMPQVIY